MPTGCSSSREPSTRTPPVSAIRAWNRSNAYVHVDVDERLDPWNDGEDDPFGDGNVMAGSRLDVADLAQQLVLSVLPMGLRCSDDCKGLCGTCGANRNASACSCENGDTRGKSKMENTAQ